MTGEPGTSPAENWTDLVLAPARPTAPPPLDILAVLGGQRPPETPPPAPKNPPPAPKPGTTTAAKTDGQAAAAVAGSGGNSLGGFNASHGNLEQLRAEIARLTPIMDTPDGQQQLMKALQDYLNAGGGQLQATDGGAQQQAGDIQGLLAGLQGGDKKPGKHSSKDDDDDDDDRRHHGKDDDAASSFKDMLSSLPQALQGLNPFGQSSPFGGGNSPFGQSSPFGGANSPFGPTSSPAGGAVTPASNPFGTSPAGTAGGLTGAATPAAATGSPFDQLKTDPATGEHKDDADGLTVSLPNGDTIQAATPELAKAIKESIANGDATAAYRAAGINIDQNPGELVDPDQVKPGYYAKYDDGHIETAAGPGKIFSNGQVVDIGSATGAADGFQGWYAPPGAAPAAPQPKPSATLTASK